MHRQNPYIVHHTDTLIILYIDKILHNTKAIFGVYFVQYTMLRFNCACSIIMVHPADSWKQRFVEVLKIKKLFIVREIGKGINEEYHMMMTDAEMTAYLKTLNENNGYIPGLGGDKSYSAVAWYARG